MKLAAQTPLMGDAIRIDGWPLPVDQGPIAGGYNLTTGSVVPVHEQQHGPVDD